MLTRRQPLLLERYWAALRRDRAAAPPDGLESDLAEQTARLARMANRLDATGDFGGQLRRRLQADAAATPDPSSWTRPAIDTVQRGLPPTTADQESEITMSHLNGTPSDVPLATPERSRKRDALLLAAAVAVFILIGVMLAAVFRGNDSEQPGGVPLTTPTPAVTPSPTTSLAPVIASPTVLTPPTAAATATSEPTATATTVPASVIATIPVGANPSDLAAGFASIWVANLDDGTVTRIDSATNQVVATIQAGTAWVTVSGDSVWVGNDQPDSTEETIARIDPSTNTVVETFPLSGVPLGSVRGIAAGFGSIWISAPDVQQVVRFDTTAKSIVATIPVAGPSNPLVTADAVWVADYYSSGTTVMRIDPATNQVVATIEAGSGAIRLAEGAGSIWVANRTGSSVSRIDPATNQVIATIPMPEHSFAQPIPIAYDEATGIWVGDPTGHAIYQIDPATNTVAATRAAEGVNSIVSSDGSLWLAQHDLDTVLRIDPTP